MTWARKHLSELLLGVAFLLGVLSSIQQLTGTTGNVWIGVVAIVVAAGAVAIFLYSKGRPRHTYRHINLRQAIIEFAPEARKIDAMFSAADQLRQAVESGAFEADDMRLHPGLRLRLMSRLRPKGDRAVIERIARLDTKLRNVGVWLEHREVHWDSFMIGGMQFGDDTAVVKFYYRRSGITHALSDDYLVVRKNRGLEDMYFRAFESAFETMWASDQAASD